MSGDKYVKVFGEFKYTKPDAVLMCFDGEEVWLPRRHLSWKSDQMVDHLSRGEEIEIELREWLANQKGLG